jgi:hypothetical protein
MDQSENWTYNNTLHKATALKEQKRLKAASDSPFKTFFCLGWLFTVSSTKQTFTLLDAELPLRFTKKVDVLFRYFLSF